MHLTVPPSHLPPFFEKIWIQILYFSPFLSLNFVVFRNSSLNLEAERLLVSGILGWGGGCSCSERCKERTEMGVKGGV
jgi:hypothetical protein